MKYVVLLLLLLLLLTACVDPEMLSPQDLRATASEYNSLADEQSRLQAQRQIEAARATSAVFTATADSAAQTQAASTMAAYDLSLRITAAALTSTTESQATQAMRTQVAYNALWQQATETAAVRQTQTAHALRTAGTKETVRYVFWYTVAGMTILAILWSIVMFVQSRTIVRPIVRDMRGDLPLLVDRHGNAFNPERSAHDHAQMTPDGVVVSNIHEPEPTQAFVARMDTTLRASGGGSTRQMLGTEASPIKPWRTFPPEQRPPTIPDDVVPILDGEWREAHGE